MDQHFLFLDTLAGTEGIFLSLRSNIVTRPPQTIELRSLPSSIHNEPINVIISDKFVSRFHIKLKARNQSQLVKAATYAVEEKFPESLENYHVVIQKNQKNGVEIRGIKTSRMNQLIQHLQDLGLQVKSINTESDLLTQSSPALIFTDKEAVLSGDELEQSYQFDASMIPIFAEKIFKLLPSNSELQLIYPEGSEIYINSLESLTPDDIRIKKLIKNERYYDSLCRNHSNGINLLQGDYSQEDEQQQVESYWRYPAWLAAAGILIYTSSIVAQNYITESRLKQQEAELTQQYIDLFPNAREPRDIEDLAKRVSSKIKTAASNSNDNTLIINPIQLFDQVSNSITNDVSIIGITLGDESAEILLESKNTESIKQFSAALAKNLTPKNSVSIESINSRNDGYHGRVRIN